MRLEQLHHPGRRHRPPLHHQPPPVARALLAHPPAALHRHFGSVPGALGPFRRVIGRRAGGSSAPFAPPALPAPRPSPCWGATRSRPPAAGTRAAAYKRGRARASPLPAAEGNGEERRPPRAPSVPSAPPPPARHPLPSPPGAGERGSGRTRGGSGARGRPTPEGERTALEAGRGRPADG